MGRESENPAEALADTECSMQLPVAAAYAERTHGGGRCVFCCPGCAAAFDGDPNGFTRQVRRVVPRLVRMEAWI